MLVWRGDRAIGGPAGVCVAGGGRVTRQKGDVLNLNRRHVQRYQGSPQPVYRAVLQLQGKNALAAGVGADDPVELDQRAIWPVHVLAVQLQLDQFALPQGRVPIARLDRHRCGVRDVPALGLAKPHRPGRVLLGCAELAQIVLFCWRGVWGVVIGDLRCPGHP